MADELTYAYYPVFRATDRFRSMSQSEVDDAAQELENLVKEWSERVSLRGAYSTVGFRTDADLMLWLVGRTPADLQNLLVGLRRTMAGRALDLAWTFMGVVKPAEFTADH